MTIADVMTKDVATCRSTDSLNRAAQLMWERRCGSVPVLDEADQLIGMVTDRDVCMAAYTQGRRIDDIPVTSAMSRPPRTCTPATSIEDAEAIMMGHGIRRLIVVEDGRIRGIVSIDDLARAGTVWEGSSEVDLERVALSLGEIARRTTILENDTPPANAPELPDGDVGDLVRNSLEALKTLRDEIRVDLDLAGKEARDTWRRLEARLHGAEIRAQEKRREGARSLAALIESAKKLQTAIRAAATSRTAAPRSSSRPSRRAS